MRTVSLPSTPAAPWLARQLLGQWCREWDVRGVVVDEATLVVSELVTDCVANGASAVEVQASLGTAELEVAVSAPPGGGSAAAANPDDDGGRRLEILRGVSSSVEVRARAEGRTVVVVVPLRRAPWST